MAIVRLTGIDAATGQERKVQTGDTIEGLIIAGGMIYRGAIPDVGSFPALGSRANGDFYTVTAVAAIVDPDTAQTLQPGDEIVWNGSTWTVIGNASQPNVEAALLNILAADEDLLIRISGALGALNVGAIGNILQVIDGGGATPQVAWGAAPAVTPKEVVDLSAGPSPVAILPTHVNKIVLVGPGPGFAVVLPDPTALNTGDEIHFRHTSLAVTSGGPPQWPLDLDVSAAGGTLEGVANGGLGLPIQYLPSATSYAGGVTVRVTEPDGGGTKDWKIVSDWGNDTVVV